MSKTINPRYQARKQKLKNFLDLRPEDRKSFLFEKENPNFPAKLIPQRLSLGLLSLSFTELFAPLSSKEGALSQIEFPFVGMIS